MAISGYQQAHANPEPNTRLSRGTESRAHPTPQVNSVRGGTILATIPDEKSSSVYSLVLTTHEDQDQLATQLYDSKSVSEQRRSSSAAPNLPQQSSGIALQRNHGLPRESGTPKKNSVTSIRNPGPSSSVFNEAVHGNTDAKAALSSHPTATSAGPAPSKPLPKIPGKGIPEFVARARSEAIRRAGIDESSGVSPAIPPPTPPKPRNERESVDKTPSVSKTSSSRPSIDTEASSRPSLQQDRRERVRARKLRDLQQSARPNINEVIMSEHDRGRPRKRSSNGLQIGAQVASEQAQKITNGLVARGSQHIILQDGSYELPGLISNNGIQKSALRNRPSETSNDPQSSDVAELSMSSVRTVASVSPHGSPRLSYLSPSDSYRLSMQAERGSLVDDPFHSIVLSDTNLDQGHGQKSPHGASITNEPRPTAEAKQKATPEPLDFAKSSRNVVPDGEPSGSIYCTPDISQHPTFQSGPVSSDQRVSGDMRGEAASSDAVPSCGNLTPKGQHMSAFFDHTGDSTSNSTFIGGPPLILQTPLQNNFPTYHPSLSPHGRPSFHYLSRSISDLSSNVSDQQKSQDVSSQLNRNSFNQLLADLDGLLAHNKELQKRSEVMQKRNRELERTHVLLKAALNAVLWTNGRLNGCPCGGLEHRGDSSSFDGTTRHPHASIDAKEQETGKAVCGEGGTSQAQCSEPSEPDAYEAYLRTRLRYST